MTRYRHGPDCVACSDPAEAARQIAADLAAAETDAAAARTARADADRTRARWPPGMPLDPADRVAVEYVVRSGHEAANLLAGRARVARAHVARVLQAHPEVPR